MKKILIFLMLTLLLCSNLFAEDNLNSPWNIHGELDMYLGYKMGVRYEINDHFDLITGFGASVIAPSSQYCYSFYTSYKTMEEYNRIQVAVNTGIIQGIFDNTSAIEDRYFLINPGVTLHLSYKIVDKLRIGAQGGMVMMVGYQDAEWGASLEPYASITFTFSE